MAEGIMKKFYGTGTYVQSAGAKGDREIDGFAIAVCEELEVELSRHQSRGFEELHEYGDHLSSFDLIVALTPSSLAAVEELTRVYHLEVEHWPIDDPAGLGESRNQKLDAYRHSRDPIVNRLIARWGPPVHAV
jgi:protein-tyrosine-phosphatase